MKKTTKQEADNAFSAYVQATNAIKKIDTDLKQKVTLLESTANEKKNILATEAQKHYETLENFANANGDLFQEKKSIQMPGGLIGYRRGLVKVQEQEGITMEDIITKFKKMLPDFLTVKVSLNLPVIKSKLDDKDTVKKLEKCGLEIVPASESFYVKVAVILMLVCSSLLGMSQTSQHVPVIGADTVIATTAYTSYFSYHYKNPVAVTYKLYQGGGNCSRATFRFKNDIPGLPTARQKDYAHHGYDEGHLCDAADMAYDCTLDESTFRFYNCVPQTPALNRGPWKSWETKIREESQTDSLFIEAGSLFSSEFIGDSVYVPALCYKVVTSLSTGTVMHVIICSNTADADCKEIDYATLMLDLNK